jgi:hypothetical protein
MPGTARLKGFLIQVTGIVPIGCEQVMLGTKFFSKAQRGIYTAISKTE